MMGKYPSELRRNATVLAAIFSGGLAAALLSCPANATELAILRNGFSIRHEHRMAIGTTTRLYVDVDDSSFTDVPTSEITGYEKDLSLPMPLPSPSPSAGPSDLRGAMTESSESAKLRSLKPAPAKSPIALNDVVNSASATYHLDPDLVNSVIHAESGFNSHAISPKGARGLMQLMPGTANQLGVNDAFDPEANVTGGSRYLRELLERYNFDLVKALAAYNAGRERVEQCRGVPPFRETRAYVARIVHEYNMKKIAQEKEARRKQTAAKAASKASSRTARAAKPAAGVVAAGPPH